MAKGLLSLLLPFHWNNLANKFSLPVIRPLLIRLTPSRLRTVIFNEHALLSFCHEVLSYGAHHLLPMKQFLKMPYQFGTSYFTQYIRPTCTYKSICFSWKSYSNQHSNIIIYSSANYVIRLRPILLYIPLHYDDLPVRRFRVSPARQLKCCCVFSLSI
jgi:hypothetical protein